MRVYFLQLIVVPDVKMEEVALRLEHVVVELDGQESDARTVRFNSYYIIFMIAVISVNIMARRDISCLFSEMHL